MQQDNSSRTPQGHPAELVEEVLGPVDLVKLFSLAMSDRAPRA
jgi:hypothetical protein